MKLRVQVVIESDDDDDHQSSAVREVAQIDRDALSVDTLGLHLEEAKNLLQKVQVVLIDEQVRTKLAEQVACPNCGRPRAHKDSKTIVTRTLFGTLHCAARAGTNVPVSRRRGAPSVRWPRRCPNGPHLNCGTWKASSPGSAEACSGRPMGRVS